MESNELKEGFIKNPTCYYFNDIIVGYLGWVGYFNLVIFY